VAPLLRVGGGQIECVRFDAASCPQGNNKVPALSGNGILDLFVSPPDTFVRRCELSS
jgi:hypothetical protein